MQFDFIVVIILMGDLAAAAQGMRQVIFTGQQCTCHMEHDDGWELENPIENLFLY